MKNKETEEAKQGKAALHKQWKKRKEEGKRDTRKIVTS